MQRLLERAVSEHKAGRLVNAERAYRKLLKRVPGHFQARLNLSLLQRQTGRVTEALESARRAVAINANDAAAHNNLANLLRESDRLEAAIAEYQIALELAPSHLNALYNLAMAYEDAGDPSAAVANYRKLIDLSPNDAGAWCALGRALLDAGDPDAAQGALERAKELRPDEPRAYRLLARRHAAADDWNNARSLLSSALELAPKSAEIRHELAQALLRLGEVGAAEQAWLAALVLEPDFSDAEVALADLYLDAGKLEAAIAHYRRYLERVPGDARAVCEMGSALLATGAQDEGVAAIERALQLDPKLAAAHAAMGVARLNQGELTRAEQACERALELRPTLGQAWLTLSRCRRYGAADDASLQRAEQALERGGMSQSERTNLHFALAKMYDDRDQAERAFAHLRTANRLKGTVAAYDRPQHEDKVRRTLAQFTPAYFAERAGYGHRSALPVFIVGMPRSGTTLVEQIISSHPLAFGAGELPRIPQLTKGLARSAGRYPDCMSDLDAAGVERLAVEYLDYLQSFAPHALRIADKLPGNFMHLGFIATLFPNATLIHCQRNAMDVCLSNYFQPFAQGHEYANDLRELGLYWRRYERIMAHWISVLPLAIHEIRYERLVDDFETEARRLVGACGLEWDARCIDFAANRRVVRTASNAQVRQPLYRSALGRWKRYAPYLAELKEALGAPS